MAKDPVFLILKPTIGWLPESEWREILGAAVKNPWSPTNDYKPKNPWAYNRNPLVEDSYNDFILRKDVLSSPSFEAEVKGLGKLRWVKSVGHQIDLSGKKVYIKRIKQHGELWRELTTRSEDFQDEVPEWVNEKRWLRTKYQVCLVVGLLMCQDVVVAASDEERKDREAKGEMPLGTIAECAAASQGVLLSSGGVGNVSAKASSATINRTYFEAKGHGKRVFALEVKIISSKKGKLTLTDDAPDSNRQLGLDDDIDLSDLILRDPQPEEWDELLQDEESSEMQEPQRSS
ncbi:hypothetical protein MMC10_010594 [Thelotrema lepadinum]|nr:hypothetical protein [Thelotrema lepadinum]